MQIEDLIKTGLIKGLEYIDYSETFTNYIQSINQQLSDELKIKSIHGKDMNYSNAQSISLFLNSDFKLISNEVEAQYKIKIWISSIEKLYALVFFEKKNFNPAIWKRFILTDNIALNHLINKIDNILGTFKLSKFPLEKEQIIADGFYTELDNRPATLFDVFFSELP